MHQIKDSALAESVGKLAVTLAWFGEETSFKTFTCLKDKVFGLTVLNDTTRAVLMANQECLSGEREVRELMEEVNELIEDPLDLRTMVKDLHALLTADEARYKTNKSLIAMLRRVFDRLDEKAFYDIERENVAYHLSVQRSEALINTKAVRGLNRLLFEYRDKSLREQTYARWDTMQLLCTGGVLMAYIGNIDSDLDWREVGTVNVYVRKLIGANADQAQAIAAMIMRQDTMNMDIIRVCRTYYEMSDPEARRKLVDALIGIAHADKVLLKDENYEINRIARLMRTPAVRYVS